MMKHFKRAASIALAALLVAVLLCACGGGSGKDVAASELASAVGAAIGKTETLAENDGTFLGLTGADAALLGDYRVLINRYGANIDEFGVFHAAKDGKSAGELKTLAEAYLARRLQIWMDEYMPEEKPKLENAEVRASGDYVIYCVLSDTDKSAAFEAFEKAVK